MALPSINKQVGNVSAPNQLLRAGSPVTFDILKGIVVKRSDGRIPGEDKVKKYKDKNERLKSSGTSGNSSQKENNQTPFVSSPFGHHGFHPQKLGKSPSTETRAPKPPKPPEKPLMPYMRYSRKVWDQVKAQNLELKLWEIGKIIGQMWRDLPSDEKNEFIEEYDADKVEYEKNLKTYYNSPPYLAFIAAKTKGKSAQITSEDRDSHDRSTGGSKQDRRIEIQPAEDDDDAEEAYSIKHVSYARYLRNHHLIHEIFSDTVVPDVRTIVTSSRMQNFYCKIQSLKMHQKKMESEVEQLVEKFETTKRKLNDASDAFQEEIQKYCKRAVDEDYFNEMVEREYEKLRKERISASNNIITLDDCKKGTGPMTMPPCDPSSTTNTDVVPEPPASLEEEQVSSEPKDDGENQTDQANEETFLTPSIPANNPFQGSASFNNQQHLNLSSSYNQTNCIAPRNPMPPPSSVQPYFIPSQLFSNSSKAIYSNPQGLPPYSASHNTLPYSSSLPHQQHNKSTARPTQQHESLQEFQAEAPRSQDQDEFEDSPNSISLK